MMFTIVHIKFTMSVPKFCRPKYTGSKGGGALKIRPSPPVSQ